MYFSIEVLSNVGNWIEDTLYIFKFLVNFGDKI